MFDFLKDLNLLRPYIARHDKWKFVLVLGLMLVAACFEAVGLGVVPVFITLMMEPVKLAGLPVVGGWFAGMPEQTSPGIMVWGSLVLLSVYLLKNVFLVGVYYVQNIVVEDQRIKLSSRVFQAYQNAPYEWHLQRNSSEFIRNVNLDTRTIIEQILMPFMAVIMSSFMTVVVITVLVVVTPGAALLAVVTVGGGFIAVVTGFRKILRRFGEIIKQENKLSVQAVMQGMGAMIDARIMHCEEYLINIFRNSIKRMARAQTLQKTVSASSPYIIEILCIFGLLVVLMSLVMQSGDLQSQLSMLSLFGVATIRLRQTMGVAAGSINTINVARSSIPHIVEDLSAIDKLLWGKKAKKQGKTIGDFQRLELKGVTYKYPGGDTPAVKDINLELKQGESIAFVGTTGCGKSTLVNIILGLLQPQEGCVEVNGVDIHQDMDGWYRNIGYIQQTIFLIDDTVRANVAFGLAKEEIKEERVWEVLRSASLDDFVKSLTNGLDTVVGERGVRLSGGQRQRLGIARALYRNPAVIVMDEATSALDNETEAAVMRAIRDLRKDRTFIMIAHRLSTVEECGRRYEMEAGKITIPGIRSKLKS
ncbi:MAG: ABC transporter ATP-binding protein [Desulfobulbaceae bacterium]